MRIWYLLESADLSGGVRIVFDQARALKRLGHSVAIKALTGDHRWYPHSVEIEYVSDLAARHLCSGEEPDVVVATFWTTVKAATTFHSSAFHLCQGYEGDIPEYSGLRSKIEETYAFPIPKLTIGPWLTGRLQELFGVRRFPIFEIGQIVDVEVFRPLPAWEKAMQAIVPRKVRILIVGIYESSVKAIRDSLEAVRVLRAKGFDIHLIRVSPWALSKEERELIHIDEYHENIPPGSLALIYRGSDIFCTSSLKYEGFGLPFAEALACGVPSIATRIPSHLSFDPLHDYACFVPEKNPAAIADAADRIIRDRRLRRYLRKRGPEVIGRNFRPESVADKLTSIFRGDRQC